MSIWITPPSIGSNTAPNGRVITWKTIYGEHAFRLPVELLPECRGATLTLGYILSYRRGLAKRRLKVALRALGMKRRTLKRHLKTLIARQLITVDQRAGVVYKPNVPPEVRKRCLYLPWFAPLEWVPVGRLPWSAQLIFAAVRTQWGIVLRHAWNTEKWRRNPFETIETVYKWRPFRFSITRLMEKTGLSRRAVIEARRMLADRGVIVCLRDVDARGRNVCVLLPNREWGLEIFETADGTVCHLITRAEWEKRKAANKSSGHAPGIVTEVSVQTFPIGAKKIQ